MSHKVVRGVCLFGREFTVAGQDRLNAIAATLRSRGFEVQSLRFCAPGGDPVAIATARRDPGVAVGLGPIPAPDIQRRFPELTETENLFFTLDLSGEQIDSRHTDVLWRLIREAPSRTFNFGFVFQMVPSSPYLPSATHGRDGFTIGLQPADLAAGCAGIDEWLGRMTSAWAELDDMFGAMPDFIGIDSSIAPGFGEGGLVETVERFHSPFAASVTTDVYLRLTAHLKGHNPRPAGLCGLMFACLEDQGLTREYRRGGFSLERNLFLSLNCGVGIDVYPIGVDERPERVGEVLRLVQGLAARFRKPLSVRFVSDGRAGIGDLTNFANPHLLDVRVRPL